MAEDRHFDGNLSLDLGNLAAYDLNPITEDSLDQVARENASKLLKALAQLPRDGVMLSLPPATLMLPRAKAIPKPKPLTKWEKFRMVNGLGRRRKRSRMVYEPEVDDYVPRWGPYSVKHVKDKLEFAKPEKNGEDQFEVSSLSKQRDRARNREKELRNEMSAKSTLQESLEVAQRSTSSRGKYDKGKKEPKVKKDYSRKAMEVKGGEGERLKSLQILEEIGRKQRKTLQG